MTEQLQNEMRNILHYHVQKYPKMQPQDLVKLLFQSEFGTGHLLTHPASAYWYFLREMEKSDPTDPWTEPVGDGICRLNLGAVREKLAPHTIFRLFQRAATVRGNAGNLNEKCNFAQRCGVTFPFSVAELDEYFSQFHAQEYPLVRHSAVYRAAYAPAYRVIRAADVALLPLLSEIDRRAASGQVCIAIDGPCGSGKTTFAHRLAQLLRCNVFHMDDFFLPMVRKTPERLAQPGGNVDYERFRSAVLEPLKSGSSFEYCPFLCDQQALGTPRRVVPTRITVVEGSYALHPTLAPDYDLSIFLTVSPEMQETRIRNRNGEAGWTQFARKWIPLETEYFTKLGIQRQCDYQFAPEDWLETRADGADDALGTSR